MITTILFTVAGTVAALEGGPRVWRFVTTHKPRLADELLALAEADLTPIASTVEKEISQVLTQTEQDALSAVQALLSGKKTAEAQVADLTQQLAAKQAELDAEKADHADLLNGIQNVIGSAAG